MINHIDGRLIEKSPVHAIIDCNGVGYYISITGSTYAKIGAEERCKLLTHVITNQQDYSQNMYGFFDEDERTVFRHLISVSGVGASTARMVLSSLNPDEVQSAIAKGEVITFKNIKGIGEKTAQRIILDLSGKIVFSSAEGGGIKINAALYTKPREEALKALQTLGFAKNNAEKAIDKAYKNDMPVEVLLKEALKNL
jgi:Holliday junction DNA helicase RuvA